MKLYVEGDLLLKIANISLNVLFQNKIGTSWGMKMKFEPQQQNKILINNKGFLSEFLLIIPAGTVSIPNIHVKFYKAGEFLLTTTA